MLLKLNEHALLGEAPPLIASVKTNAIADPNTTLEPNGIKKGRKLDWTCGDWIIFHKSILQWFKEGRFSSRRKYPPAEALIVTNQVFMQHWQRASWTITRCGYTADFAAYFTAVGLRNEVLNILQRTVDSGKDKTAKVVDSVTNTGVNLVDSAGNIVNNAGAGINSVVGLAKYILPVTITGVVVFAGAYVYKNFIKKDNRFKVATPTGVSVEI